MSDEIREGLEGTDSGADVSETDTEDTGSNVPEEKLFSQADVDRVVAKRLKRAEEASAKRFADYDQLKEAAEAYSKIQDEKATDAERWEKERNKLLADLQDRDENLTKLQRANLVADLAADAKLPKSFWKRVQGESEEEIAEDIKSIIEDLGIDVSGDSKEDTPKKPAKKAPAFGGGGRTPDPEPDTDAIVANIPRGPQLRVK